MATARGLLKKIAEVRRDVFTSTKGDYDKVDLREEIREDSLGASKITRTYLRGFDGSFGQGYIGDEPKVAARFEAVAFDRFDFDPGAGTDFGVRMTMAAGVLDNKGMNPGDKVQVLEGDKEGTVYTIESIPDATTLRFVDDAGKSTESNIQMRARFSSFV